MRAVDVGVSHIPTRATFAPATSWASPTPDAHPYAWLGSNFELAAARPVDGSNRHQRACIDGGTITSDLIGPFYHVRVIKEKFE